MAIIVLFGTRRSMRPRRETLRSRSSGTASITIHASFTASCRSIVKWTRPGCVPFSEQ